MTSVNLTRFKSVHPCEPLPAASPIASKDMVDLLTRVAPLPESKKLDRVIAAFSTRADLTRLRGKAVKAGRAADNALEAAFRAAPTDVLDALRTTWGDEPRAAAVFVGLARGANLQGNHAVLGEALQRCASMIPNARPAFMNLMWKIFLGQNSRGKTPVPTEDIVAALRHLWALPLPPALDSHGRKRWRGDVAQALQARLEGKYVPTVIEAAPVAAHQKVLAAYVNQEIDNDSDNFHGPSDGVQIPCIHRTFWSDINRQPLTLRQAGKADRSFKSGDGDVQKAQGLQELLAFCNGDARWLLAVSRLAHQGTTSTLVPKYEDDATWPLRMYGEPLWAELQELGNGAGQTIAMTHTGDSIVLEFEKSMSLTGASGSRKLDLAPGSRLTNKARIVIPRPEAGGPLQASLLGELDTDVKIILPQ